MHTRGLGQRKLEFGANATFGEKDNVGYTEKRGTINAENAAESKEEIERITKYGARLNLDPS